MHFGVCAKVEDAAWIKDAGADFLESFVQPVLRPMDEKWKPPVSPRSLPLPLVAYNMLYPATLKITGPQADLKAIEAYTRRACERCARMGSLILVFGSGGARTYPDGWPREKAEAQLVDAMRVAGPLAKAAGVLMVMEPLNRGESNILTSMTEGLDYIRRAAAPGLSILCDLFHFAVEKEPLTNLDQSRGLLTHVHIAEPVGRVPPQPGMTDYRPFFAKLKAVGYDARISVECTWKDMKQELGPTLEFLRSEWLAA